MMVESTDFRNLNDLSQFRRLNQSWVGCVLFQRQVSPEIAIVEEVFFENPFQMPFSEHDHMIQALSANAADEAFRERILPRTPCRREHFSNAHSLNPSSKLATVYSITVSDEISRRRIVREGFNDLLRRPFGRGMLRDIEMQHAATLMRQHDEYE